MGVPNGGNVLLERSMINPDRWWPDDLLRIALFLSYTTDTSVTLIELSRCQKKSIALENFLAKYYQIGEYFIPVIRTTVVMCIVDT